VSITIITDGSADNRTGIGGWAAIVRTPDTLTELTGYADNTTSNRMELMAVLEGLRSVSIPSQITVITDSSYVLNTMRNEWYKRWFAEEPLRLATPRPNMDLWHAMSGLAQYHQLSWVKIKGHSGDYWNERADRLADLARREKIASQHLVEDWIEGIRCPEFSPSSKQCKLHKNHSGNCYFTSGVANGVEIYGEMSLT